MEKIHTIKFTTDGDIEKLTKDINEVIKKAYDLDKKENKVNEDFIKTVVKLTKLTFNLSEEDAKAVDGWLEHMISLPIRDKRSFVACYRKHFADIAHDIVGLALDYENLLDKKG